jgi:adenylate cyclase
MNWTRGRSRRWTERLLRRLSRQARQLARSDEGVTLAVRVGGMVAVACVVSNLVGATIVFVIAGPVRPNPPDVEHPGAQLLLNLSVLGGYLLVAVGIGAVWSVRLVLPVLRWLLPETDPDESQQRYALRYPLTQAKVFATFWALAIPLFFLLNVFVSLRLALSVATTVVLGGLSTIAVGYLIVERLWRPVSAAALRAGAPERPALPGVASRALVVWLLGSGVPVLGILLVAVDPIGLPKQRFAFTVAILSAIALTVGLLAQVFAARSVADPLTGVRAAVEQVAEGELDVSVRVYDGSEIGLLQSGVNRMAEGLRERERLRDLFGRQVGADVAERALADNPSLGGESREVAVLFVDLIGSTGLAERRDPEEVVEMLNSFFSDVVRVVADHGGLVNKFEGDAALCIFGAPAELEDAYTACLCAARAMTQLMQDLPEPLAAGVGVSAGRAVAGWVGAESRYEYTVIGDPVNEAARLSDEAKSVDPRLLASERLVERADDQERECWEHHEDLSLRGRSASTSTYRPRDLAGNDCRHQQQQPGKRRDEEAGSEARQRPEVRDDSDGSDSSERGSDSDGSDPDGSDSREPAETTRGAGS